MEVIGNPYNCPISTCSYELYYFVSFLRHCRILAENREFFDQKLIWFFLLSLLEGRSLTH